MRLKKGILIINEIVREDRRRKCRSVLPVRPANPADVRKNQHSFQCLFDPSNTDQTMNKWKYCELATVQRDHAVMGDVRSQFYSLVRSVLILKFRVRMSCLRMTLGDVGQNVHENDDEDEDSEFKNKSRNEQNAGDGWYIV